MNLSLRTKLSLAFVLVAMLSIFATSVLINSFLEKQFKQYVVQKQENRNKEITALIAQQYTSSGKWNINAIKGIGVNALGEGLIIRVKDVAGKNIWDAVSHNSGLCKQMIDHMANNMASRYPNWEGKYIEKKYPISFNFNRVGTVDIGYYGPFYYTDNDLTFINLLNNSLYWIALAVLIFSLLIGVFISKTLSTPIIKVIDTAQTIEKGDYKVRSKEKSTTKEIGNLILTINNLARTLETQEKLRKQLTGDVAHELRTPMATLQSHVEAMIDGIWEPSPERLKSCHEEIVRVNKMIGDLGKLAKYESDNLVLSKTKFDLTELIENVVMNFESQFKNKGVGISYKGDKGIIFADKDMITQVFVNLISNALKYTSNDGNVEIVVKGKGDVSEVIVKDTGQGISEEDLPNIFERFYRADKSRNRMTGGSGIGLTISQAIVKAHGGEIKVQSEVNKGTKFTVLLPKK
ncbi:MAG: sensor histidine kinase [Ignavibacteriales bacterium]